jgi:hypothetical protein
MGKIILEFDSIEEAEDAREALDGYKWKMTVWDIDQYLRSEIKYNEKLSSLEYQYAEKLREEIRIIINNYNLNLE